MSEVEALRRIFRPSQITTLFVGESAPRGDTFFYKADSTLYREMRKSFGGGPDFLSEFKANGFYLDDLVLSPINGKNPSERNRYRQKGVSSLAQRMADYRPAAVVSLLSAIEPMVRQAMHEAGLSNLPLYVTPFPGNGQQTRFKARMAEIIPKLPTTKRPR